MTRTFVLCIVSLLIFGFAKLVVSFKSCDDILPLCKINKENDTILIECLAKQNGEIDKERAKATVDNDRIQFLLRKNMECFKGEPKAKMDCYTEVFRKGWNKNRLFSANYISLFFWFQRNTYTVLSACGMTKSNSDGVFSCIENLEKKSAEIFSSDKKNREEKYDEMVHLVSEAIPCYGKVTPTQATCLFQQTEVLKKKFTAEINQQRNEMKEKLSSCKISDERITQIITCIKPKDTELVDLSFKMLTNTKLASKVLSLWRHKKYCIKLHPEVIRCIRGNSRKRPDVCKSSINPFHFDVATRNIIQYINRSSILMLKTCELTMEKYPLVYMCLGKKFKENQDVLSKDPKTALIAMIRLMNVSANCFENVNKSIKMCLYQQKQYMIRNLQKEGLTTARTGIHIIEKCAATHNMTVCVTDKLAKILTKLSLLLNDPSIAAKFFDLGSSLPTCLDDDLVIKKCVMDKVMAAPQSDKHNWFAEVNVFRTDEAINAIKKFILTSSKSFPESCNVRVDTQPNVFKCLGKKYKDNTDVSSKDVKTAFIAIMKLVNVSAECFVNVTKYQKICLYEKKEVMRQDIRDKTRTSAKVAFHMLDACKATPKMKTCVKSKADELMTLGKTMLTDPSIAGKLYDLTNSLKTCLDEDANVKQCVLDKNPTAVPFNKWYGSGYTCPFTFCKKRKSTKERFVEKLTDILADCQVTDENVKDFFNCLKGQNVDLDNLSTEEYKEMFYNGMKFVKAFNTCSKKLPDANQLCLSNKKNQMMNEKIKEMEELLDKFLSSCGATESGNPELFNCLKPKRIEMKTQLLKNFDGNTASADLWKLAQGMKDCFDSEPQIEKCFRQKAINYQIFKLGKHIWSNSMSDIYCKINDAFKKCKVNEDDTPDLYHCMKFVFHKVLILFSRRNFDSTTLMQRLQKMKSVTNQCIANVDEETKTCLKEESESLKNHLLYFRKSAHRFDTKAMMNHTDRISAKCNITVESTPTLKRCLDNITLAVLEIKPWLPMTDERRAQLKLQNGKYWKCFKGIHEDHRKCMLKMVESFSKKGSLYYDKFIDSVASKCKRCSKTQCFQIKVENAAKIYRGYIKAVLENNNTLSIAEKFRKAVVKALICLRYTSSAEKSNAFNCLTKVKEGTFNNFENMAKRGTLNGPLKRKRRDADADAAADDDDVFAGPDDDDEVLLVDNDALIFDDLDGDDFGDPNNNIFDFNNDTNLSFFTFMSNGETDNGQRSSASVMQMLYTDKSMNRVNTVFNLMKTFISTCTNWAPTPEAARSRQIIDHGGLPPRPPSELFDRTEPVPKIDPDFIQCQKMYDDINSFIDTGEEQAKYLPDDDKNRKSSVTTAAIGGVVGGVIVSAVIVPIFIIFIVMKRGRCSKQKSSTPCILSCRTTPICSTMPQKPIDHMPPSYQESVEEGKLHKSVAGLSQILESSTRESTEKNC